MSNSKKILLTIISIVIFAGLFYAGLAYYYAHPFTTERYNYALNEKAFTYGTYINDMYCTGMTAVEVDRCLSNVTDVNDISIITKDDNAVISAESIGLNAVYTNEVKTVLNKQNPLLWGKNIISFERNEIKPEYVYNEEAFEKEFEKLKLDQCNFASNDVYLELSDDGYIIVDNKEHEFDLDAFKQIVIDSIKNGESQVCADDSLYKNNDYTEDEKNLISFYDELQGYQNREVVYHFGNEVKKINGYEWDKLYVKEGELPSKITDYKRAKELFTFEISQEEAVSYIDEFLDEYNTYNNRYFKGHNGKWVHVKKGNYGNKIDVAKEEEWFKEFVAGSDLKATRTPTYLIEANYKEKNDFGDTFIEISIDEQMMWYYVDGEVYVETPITSGSLANGGTDPRVVFVYVKIPNKWLNGPTWHSFVKYWVAIQGAIGIHDASWRSVYGGTEYLYNGSHGCVNTPLEAMAKLYERVEVGTPVIVYSIEKNGVESRD